MITYILIYQCETIKLKNIDINMMLSKLLTITNKEKAREFVLIRNKEITMFSIYLLLLRVIDVTASIISHFIGTFSTRRLILMSGGSIWQAVALFLSWKYPFKFQALLAPFTILSNTMYIFNSTDVDNSFTS
jgi:hypothetical protein